MEPTFNFNAHNRGKLALKLRTVEEMDEMSLLGAGGGRRLSEASPDKHPPQKGQLPCPGAPGNK